MDLGTVSVAGMAGMGFSGLIATGLPVFLMLYLQKREKAKIQFFFAGGLIFIASALILEQMCHMLVRGLTGDVLLENIALYALYGGLAAAVFEETGRLLAVKYFRKSKRLTMDNANAFMYGAGHGGTEAILLVGLSCFNNLTTSIMLNTGSLTSQLEALDEETKKQAMDGIRQLTETPAYLFYLAGVERILAIALQIALTILVYLGVKYAKKQLVILAYAAHFLVDALVVLLSNYLNAVATECLVAALVAAAGSCAYLFWQKYEHGDSSGNKIIK